MIHSVSDQPNPGILKSVQGKYWACCIINVFHLSFFFLSYSSLQKVLWDQILPEQALIHCMLNGLHYVEIISAVPKGCLLSKIWENWTKVSIPICLAAFKDCENIFLNTEVAFLPSSKHLTSLHIYQTTADNSKMGTWGMMYFEHCTSYVTSTWNAIFKMPLAEYMCTNM